MAGEPNKPGVAVSIKRFAWTRKSKAVMIFIFVMLGLSLVAGYVYERVRGQTIPKPAAATQARMQSGFASQPTVSGCSLIDGGKLKTITNKELRQNSNSGVSTSTGATSSVSCSYQVSDGDGQAMGTVSISSQAYESKDKASEVFEQALSIQNIKTANIAGLGDKAVWNISSSTLGVLKDKSIITVSIHINSATDQSMATEIAKEILNKVGG